MKNIFSIAALCLVGTQAVTLRTESAAAVDSSRCGCDNGGCLHYQAPRISPSCASCNPVVCQ